MKKRRTGRGRRTRRADRLEKILSSALALTFTVSGCDSPSGGSISAADSSPPYIDSGGCTPGSTVQVPLCGENPTDSGVIQDQGVVGGAPLPTDGGPDLSMDASPPADASPPEDAAGTPDAVPTDASVACVPDLRTGDDATTRLPLDVCLNHCPPNDIEDFAFCEATPSGLECHWEFCGVGRRADGARLEDLPPTGKALGAWLGAAAGLEAASVTAFERLEGHLVRLGAPAELVAGVREAAADERRHARSVGTLAQRYGDDLRPWALPPDEARTPFELARENRVEGCVRETFGAAVVAYQAQHATDPVVGQAMADIAIDEAEHARLSWRIAAWLEPQLTPAELRAVQVAATEAASGLAVPSLDPSERRLAGLPDETAVQAMRVGLQSLWHSTPAEVLAAV